MSSTPQDPDYLNQLRWRSRRGLLELELLLLPFAAEQLDGLSAEQLLTYERLLDCEDLDIYDWLQQRAEPEEAGLREIAETIRMFQRSRG